MCYYVKIVTYILFIESNCFSESVVKPALLDCQSRFLADLKTKKEDMDKYSARLSVVRERKANLGANFGNIICTNCIYTFL